MVIDCHVHLLHEKGYVEKLISICDSIGIDRVCLLAGPAHYHLWGSRCGGNNEVLEAYRKYPDRLIPFAFFDLGMDVPSMIDQFYEAGFRGVKITRPHVDYDDRSVYPVYSRTSILAMPILFHVGTVVRTPWDFELDVRCDRMRPIRLDSIARAFPEQNVIGAHLGNPWYEEACMSLFWNENLFFDLSGTVLKRKTGAWFKEMLWWDDEMQKKVAPNIEKTLFHEAKNKRHPWERICFGTDAPLEEIASCHSDYLEILNNLNVPQSILDRVMGMNLANMLKIQ